MCKDMRPLVLVVEDDAHIARGLSKNLELDGFRVRVAKDGTTGLDMAVHDEPDIVLLDDRLPKMTGAQVLREIRRRELDTRVIMLSTNMQELDRCGCPGDADDYVAKPFSLTDLLRRVRRLED